MKTVYLDHNIIDWFDKGKTAHLEPLLADDGCLPIISIASVDEIFRGGDESRSIKNIESLKKLGVRYIHSSPDESHMAISELDYENMHWTWIEMQRDIGALNDSHFRFLSTLFREDEPDAIQDMDKSVNDQIAWIKGNYSRFPNAQMQMDEILRNAEEDKPLYRQLIYVKRLLPFTSKEINNTPARSVFWTCIGKLKNSADKNLRLIGNHVTDAIRDAKTIDRQLEIVLLWLNLFRYHSDDLTRIARVRSNLSDVRHATYGIACDGILTLDKRFAKRVAAAIAALGLRTEVDTDARTLLSRIAQKSSSR